MERTIVAELNVNGPLGFSIWEVSWWEGREIIKFFSDFRFSISFILDGFKLSLSYFDESLLEVESGFELGWEGFTCDFRDIVEVSPSGSTFGIEGIVEGILAFEAGGDRSVCF